ncbi:MAG: hypothetical protein A2X48_04860 [Lentisphaerae bacterium GWF2_49_21]|nr:MAG: hypothetical protein A2X48_04860 [Lentisphaerae bacterium GWF2_49_21]
MTGKERTLLAINFEPTDRIPVVGGFVRHPQFLAEMAGVSVEEFWTDPRKTAIRAFHSLGVDVIIGLILPNRDSSSGAQHDIHKQTRFDSPEAMLDDIAKLPSLSDLHKNFVFQKHYDDYLKRYKDGQTEIGEEILWIPNTFDCVAQFQNEGYFGAENYYMALSLFPEAMNRFFEHSGETAFLRNTAVAKAIVENDLPRVMWLGQDSCDNRGPYIAPEIMNDIYIRHVKRSLEPLKDIGVKIIWHSDGNIMPIVPYLLDAGIDGFQGMQETIETKVDVEKLGGVTTRAGKKPIIVGSLSSITIMPFGTPDDVRADVVRCQELARKRDGGWLLNFSSSIGPEVPAANIQAFFDQASRKPK